MPFDPLSPRAFKNEGKPISDKFEALELLFGQWQDKSIRRLILGGDGQAWIQVDHYSSGPYLDRYLGSDYYLLDRMLCIQLLDVGWIEDSFEEDLFRGKIFKISEVGERAHVEWLFPDGVPHTAETFD